MRPIAVLVTCLALMACEPATLSLGARSGLEVHVKTNHAALSAEISSGGGPTLTRAMDLAGIPEADRPTRALQLQSNAEVYAASPGALVTALTIYGSRTPES